MIFWLSGFFFPIKFPYILAPPTPFWNSPLELSESRSPQLKSWPSLQREFSNFQLSSVQLLSRVWLFATPWAAVHQASLSNTNSHRLLKLMSTESVMLSNHLILCCPLLLLPSIFPRIRVFSNESALAKVFKFQLQHQSFQWTPRIDLLLDGLVGSPCSPRDSQESSPTPEFKRINSSVLSFLYSPSLTSIHDYWKMNSLD